MKPEMERLMYEIVLHAQGAGGETTTLEELGHKFGVKTPVKKERLRNAVSRLCSLGHLKNKGGSYVFLRGIDKEPPRVSSLFPGDASPSQRTMTVVKTQTFSEDALRRRASQSESARPEPRDSLTPGKMLQNWILKTLEKFEEPLSMKEIVRLGTSQGIANSPAQIRNCLSKLLQRKRIQRPFRGHYQATRVLDLMPSERPLHVQVCKGSSLAHEDYAGVLKEDIAFFETLIDTMKEDAATAEARAILLRRRIQEYQYLVVQRERALSGLASGPVLKKPEVARA